MYNHPMEIIIAIVALVAGFVAGWALKPKSAGNQEEIKRLVAEKAAAEAKFKMLNEGALIEKFKNISAELLELQKKSVAEEQVKTLVPFTEQIKELKDNFDKRIGDMLKDSADSKKDVMEHVNKLLTSATTMMEKTDRVANAISGGNKKLEGNWGEAQLINLFTQLGWEKNRDYEYQPRFNDNKDIPDFVINLPDNLRRNKN